MLRKIVTLLAVIGVITGIIVASFLHSAPIENELYRDFFTAEALETDNKGFLLLSKPGNCETRKNSNPDIPSSLVKSFLAANESAMPIKLSSLKGYIDVVAYSDAKNLQELDYRSFIPDGYILVTLSRVGFIKNRKEALFCIETIDFSQDFQYLGRGDLIYMIRDKDGWSIKKTILSWVS